MKTLCLFAGLAALSFGFLQSVHGQDSGVAPADRGKVLGVGDTVTLEIREDREQPVARRVSDTGDLDVPYIGRVHVAGQATAEVASRIKRLLEADYYYQATVRLSIDQVNPQGKLGKIFISGEVKAPGPQVIDTTERVMASAIVIRAGGFDRFADERKVKVTSKRSGDTSVVDIKAVIERGETDKDVEVRDGDYIFVPKALIKF